MTTIVWSTESVDTSAMLLAQTLDDVLFTKSPLDVAAQANNQEVVDALRDPENQVIFYGAVSLPEWFRDHHFDPARMFSDPAVSKLLVSRKAVSDVLAARGVLGIKYVQLGDKNFTRLREDLGRTFDLVRKPGQTPVATVSSAEEFLAARAGARYACTHIAATRRLRVFMGLPNITNGGIIGVSSSEKRALSFMETLTYGCSVDVRNHIERQFLDGTLTEEMGRGRETIAWTEEIHSQANAIEAGLLTSLQTIATAAQASFKLDFAAFDFVGEANGRLHLSNATTSPSLTNDDVLTMVSAYHRTLLTDGRKVSKDTLLRLIQNLTDDQVDMAARLLRNEGVLTARA